MLKRERPTIGASPPSLRTILIRALFGRLAPPSLFGQARKKAAAVVPSIGLPTDPACGTKYDFAASGTCACTGALSTGPISIVISHRPSLVFIGSPPTLFNHPGRRRPSVSLEHDCPADPGPFARFQL